MKEYSRLSEEEQEELYSQFLQEPDAFYEKAETDQLRDALKKSYTERFLMATTLYKVQQTLNKAKITNKPYTLPE
ncbi:MAG: hypothetical protein WDO19_12390 [Bacteroidota bacterium]